MPLLPAFLPWSEQPALEVGGIVIYAFGVLATLSLISFVGLAALLAHRREQGARALAGVAAIAMAVAVPAAHLVGVLVYYRELLVEHPSILFQISVGLSSFGGFAGGAAAAYLVLRQMRKPPLPHVDTLVTALLPAWCLARLGCTLAHDHPGRSTTFFLAFDHPEQGPIHDLGFYELLFALLLTAVAFLPLWKRARPGLLTAVICIGYSVFRLLLDFLQPDDGPRLGLTPTQWLALLCLALGCALAWWVARRR